MSCLSGRYHGLDPGPRSRQAGPWESGFREGEQARDDRKNGVWGPRPQTPEAFLLPEHPVEDRIDVFEVVTKIEQRLELGDRQQCGHFGVGGKQVEELQGAV